MIEVFVLFGLVCGGFVVVRLFWSLADLDTPRRPRQVETSDAPPVWSCGSPLCVPSRENTLTGAFSSDYRVQHAAELLAQYERSADDWRYGSLPVESSLEDSRIERTAEEAALLLGYGSEYRESLAAGYGRPDALALPAGDDYIETTWREVGDYVSQR